MFQVYTLRFQFRSFWVSVSASASSLRSILSVVRSKSPTSHISREHAEIVGGMHPGTRFRPVYTEISRAAVFGGTAGRLPRRMRVPFSSIPGCVSGIRAAILGYTSAKQSGPILGCTPANSGVFWGAIRAAKCKGHAVASIADSKNQLFLPASARADRRFTGDFNPNSWGGQLRH